MIHFGCPGITKHFIFESLETDWKKASSESLPSINFPQCKVKTCQLFGRCYLHTFVLSFRFALTWPDLSPTCWSTFASIQVRLGWKKKKSNSLSCTKTPYSETTRIETLLPKENAVCLLLKCFDILSSFATCLQERNLSHASTVENDFRQDQTIKIMKSDTQNKDNSSWDVRMTTVNFKRHRFEIFSFLRLVPNVLALLLLFCRKRSPHELYGDVPWIVSLSVLKPSLSLGVLDHEANSPFLSFTLVHLNTVSHVSRLKWCKTIWWENTPSGNCVYFEVLTGLL